MSKAKAGAGGSALSAEGDKIGPFPAAYDTDALPQRRLAAYARIISIVAAVEGAAIISLSLAIAALMPLQKVVPMVVTPNPKGDEIIRVNPLTLDSPSSDYVTEVALRDYIQRRYSIIGDGNSQATQWGPGTAVEMMSAPQVYQDFIAKAKPEFENLVNQGMTRSVRIDRVSKLGETTWQVEYVTTDLPASNPTMPTAPGTSRAWVATMQVEFEPKNVTYSQRLVNPLGLTIKSINEAQRD